jgi:iron complex outermembrane receptor protein
MKKSTLFVVLLCVLTMVGLQGASAMEQARAKRPLSVYIVAGQSNADGRVPVSQLPPYLQTGAYRHCLWSYGSGDMLQAPGRFTPFRPHVAKAFDEDRWGFDAVLYHLLDSAVPRPFYVIKQTVGGTAIDTLCRRSTRGMFWCADPVWLAHEQSASRGGHSLLLALTEQIDACVDSTLSQLAEGYEVRALIWHQGEGDQPQAARYAHNFSQVVSAIRQHLVQKTGDPCYAQLPVICGTFAKGSRQGSPQVAQALRQVAQADANIHVVEASDLTLLRDQLHFDAQGAEQLGRRVFRKLHDITSTQPDERALNDSTDIFFRHLQLNELVVTGVTGNTKLKHATAPVSIVRPQELRATASSNVIDAIAHQPGLTQLTTGGVISKPIIRGLGYNRVVVMSEGVRQEGQQWGDEHGVEVDGNAVHSVEILKGPASLMYGADAMAGVVILHSQPTPAEGTMRAQASTEYQTNNGLFGYTLSMGGNQHGFVWDARFSQKMAHAYQNRYDGYVPGSQFHERAGRLKLGIHQGWGHSLLTCTAYHLTPSIIEGERDELTGELVRSSASQKSYGKSLPFQQVKHYKLVWDNAFNLSWGYLKAIVGYQQNRRQEYEESRDDYEAYFQLHTLTYDLRYLTHEWDGWKLSTGIGGMYQRSLNKGEEALIPEYRLFDVGFYATVSKQLNRWTLNGGLRYDHRRVLADELIDDEGDYRFRDLKRHFSGLTGSVGAVWNISEQLDMRVNVARGFRTPNLSELSANGVHEGSQRYELGNGSLQAEYSLQADLGLDFTSGYVSAQLALFANRIDNYIFIHRMPTELKKGYLTYAYTQGDARLLGFEAGADLHPVHSLHFENTFSYVDARQLHQSDNSIRYLPFTPAPRWTSDVKWELMHHAHPTVGHRHSSSVSHHHHPVSSGFALNNVFLSAGIECYLAQNHIYSADDTETATPSYTLVNLSAGTDILLNRKKVAELYVTADNLFDRAYQNHLSRLKYADVNAVTGRRGVYNMGRNITIKLVISCL